MRAVESASFLIATRKCLTESNLRKRGSFGSQGEGTAIAVGDGVVAGVQGGWLVTGLCSPEAERDGCRCSISSSFLFSPGSQHTVGGGHSYLWWFFPPQWHKGSHLARGHHTSTVAAKVRKANDMHHGFRSCLFFHMLGCTGPGYSPPQRVNSVTHNTSAIMISAA